MWWLTIHRWAHGGPSGMDLLDEHLAWNRREHEAGRLLFSGPADGLALAIMVFRGGPDLPRDALEALVATEPFVTQIESGGGRVVIDVLGEEGIPEAGYVTSESFAEENPNTVAAFKRAVRKGAALAVREPERVAQILPTYTQTPAEVAREVTPPEFVDRNDVAKVQALADRMRAAGGLERDVQVAEFMDAR